MSRFNIGNVSEAMYGRNPAQRRGAPNAFMDNLSPQAQQTSLLGSSLGYQALPQLQTMMDENQAASRFGQEQQRFEDMGIRGFMQAQGRYDDLEGSPMWDDAENFARSSMTRGVVPDFLPEKMYQRQANVIEGETQRSQQGMLEALSRRGLQGSGQGLGAIAGMSRNRMGALTNAKRDVDIWAAQENLKGRAQANAVFSNLLNLKATVASRRADLDMSLRMNPTDYSGFTKTSSAIPGQIEGPRVVGYNFGDGGGGRAKTGDTPGVQPGKTGGTGSSAKQLTNMFSNKQGTGNQSWGGEQNFSPASQQNWWDAPSQGGAMVGNDFTPDFDGGGWA